MATNPYFRHLQYNGESSLLDDLMVESIQQFGSDTYYLPREFQKEDLILGEDTLSKFTKSYQMEMYIEVFDRFGGQGDFIQKFGIEVEDTASLLVSIRVFNQACNGAYPRPREGDLIFFPLPGQLFEITFVENEPTFYQLGKQYVYQIKCRLFRYTDQEIDVGVPEIDTYADQFVYSMFLTAGSGSGTYTAGEIAYQGTDLGTATGQGEVITYNTTTKVLELKNIIGEFLTTNGNIKGNSSNASYTLVAVDTDYNNASQTNSELETEGSAIQLDNNSIFGKY